MAGALLALLAACGGGGTSDPAAPVARVEILSAGAWLPGAGQTRALAAQAFDADGNPVDAAVTWRSSRPGAVAVDGDGRLTAAAATGSAQITAQAGGVSSGPILAVVATPAPGVTLVADAAIVGGPVETDPAAVPSLANTYQVTLDGAAPAVGALLLGDGDTPLAGRVTAVAAMGAQTLVTLELVPIAELFATLEIEEVFDLSRVEVLVPPEVSDFFDVARSGDTWNFTPKPPGSSQRKRPSAVTGTYSRDILPFRSCEVELSDFEEIGDLPFGMELPTFSLTLSPTVDAHYSRLGGLTRFIVRAEPQITQGLTLKADAALSGSVECTLQLFALRLPIGGPLAFFIGGLVPVGVGFELEAEATLASFRIGVQSEAGTKLSAGWDCPAPACDFVRSLEDPVARLTPVFDAPNPADDARLEVGLSVFGYVEAELGNPFLRSLRFKAFEERIGGKLEGNFAPPVTQMLDAAYASDYGASIEGSAKVGTGIDQIVTLLGFGSLTSIGLDFTHPLATSLKALKIEADRASFGAGDVVNVQVTLDPATLDFLPGVYNVDSVQLRRRVGSLTEVLATQAAGSGQQVFDFSVSAPHAGDVSEWVAFVTTTLLPFELTSLELGAVSGSPLEPEPQPIPLGSYLVPEGLAGYMRLQSPSEQFPGQGECELQVPEFGGQIPFDWTRQASCVFQEGTITFRLEGEHTNRGSGRLAFASTGRFQTSTSHHASLDGGTNARVSEYFRITAPGMSGRIGTAVGRLRVRVNGQIPADFLGCSNCLAQAGAQLRIEAAGGLGLVDERLYSGPNVDPGLLRPSVDMEHVLTIPLAFNYGEPFTVFVDGGVSMSIGGNHQIAVDSGVSMAYEWLDFSGLAEGAVVESYGGPVAAAPTDGF